MKYTISQIIRYSCVGVTDEEKKKAKQLADTAPELLKVCKKAMESEIDGSYVSAVKWWGQMKEAIKKATQ